MKSIALFVGAVISFIITIAIVWIFCGLITMLLWNLTISTIFDVKEITFLQGLYVFIFSKILFFNPPLKDAFSKKEEKSEA